MSQKKHLHTLSELSAHPIARNIEWSELIPALASIGLLHEEKNGNYHFSRNGHTLVFEHSHHKVLGLEEVLKLRHFLQMSALTESDNEHAAKGIVIAIDHHKAFVFHDPGTESASVDTFQADETHGRLLHTPPTAAPFNDSNPFVDNTYYQAIIKSLMKSYKVVILSHGTGTSSAGNVLLDIMRAKFPQLLHRVVAVKNCDLEALTEPQMIELGIELLHGKVMTPTT